VILPFSSVLVVAKASRYVRCRWAAVVGISIFRTTAPLPARVVVLRAATAPHTRTLQHLRCGLLPRTVYRAPRTAHGERVE